ncbi:hypothetical protein HEB94_000578 [Actinopolymorpha pittospori]|uniref:DNA primase/polymerase bifunctional N-terminal domain-containing protein n=1 Tax=Actinopolymorpha pittospori TaxID=648752 RepID=A0A927MUV2_9ACTN|nr:hypothetical protein [Actinopolymorpha pittospori]
MVVDLDTPNPGDAPPQEWVLPGITNGADLLAELAARAGQPLPVDTYTVQTGRGGLHLYFTTPSSGETMGNSAGRLGWHVDTRGGGYVVAAGS